MERVPAEVFRQSAVNENDARPQKTPEHRQRNIMADGKSARQFASPFAGVPEESR